jgi:alanine racemase
MKTKLKIYRQNFVEIDKSAFISNFKEIQKQVSNNVKIMPILKDNAYGHGAISLAKEIQKLNVVYIGVASIEEGIQFRNAKIKTKILILGNSYPFEAFYAAAKYNLTLSISSENEFDFLRKFIKKTNKKIEFHLKIDTGMGRIGISTEAAYRILEKISEVKEIKMTGIFTHFPVSDTNKTFTENQIKIFSEIVGYARSKLGVSFLAHCANSAAIFKFKNSYFDMVRPGIALYGLSPFGKLYSHLKIKPILSWKTKIIYLKKVEKGFSVSYGNDWIAKKESLIATIPVGYGDGYNRLLSNKFEILVGGKRCPIAGRITMDMAMVDVSEVKNAAVGDEAVLIGKQGKEEITIQEIADICGTINYEISSSISNRVVRIDKK